MLSGSSDCSPWHLLKQLPERKNKTGNPLGDHYIPVPAVPPFILVGCRSDLVKVPDTAHVRAGKVWLCKSVIMSCGRRAWQTVVPGRHAFALLFIAPCSR